MPSKTPHNSGKPTGHGRKPSKSSGKDVDMKDASKSKTKKESSKDADEEMTVVVPPPKNAKQPASAAKTPAAADADGDVAMGGEEAEEPKVDPVEQAVSGTFFCSSVG